MINNLFKRNYQTLNKIEINKKALINNFQYLSSLNRKIKIAPVLKSNAYGHGILEIASILDPLGASFFCVNTLCEAYQLFKAKNKTPILIMGYTDPQNLKVKKLPFSFAVFDLETIKVLNKFQPVSGVHIFVDTGMNREGVKLRDLSTFLQKLKRYPDLKVEGLMSHLASADNLKDPLNKIQIKNFKKAYEICRKNDIHPKWIHIQNSDGLSLHLRGVSVNMARVGLAIYGIGKDPNLKPVLSLKSKIIQIKRLNKKDRVGYGGIFTVKRGSMLGVLPLGYYDGIDRRLSNIGSVTMNGINCPIIGNISMNITTIDITSLKNPKVGDDVIVYSQYRADKNSIENASKLCNTIPYYLLVKLTSSIRRVIS